MSDDRTIEVSPGALVVFGGADALQRTKPAEARNHLVATFPFPTSPPDGAAGQA